MNTQYDMIKRTIITFILTSAGLLSFSQNVTDIIVNVTGDDKMAIDYNIAGAKFYQTFNVSIYVSLDNGAYWQGPLMEVNGDVGKGISKGSKTIIWDFLKEIPITDEEVIFDVRVEVVDKPIQKSFFVSYVGNMTTYAGLRLGMIGKTGWYVEGRLNPAGFSNPEYDYIDGKVKNYNKPGYYEFNGRDTWSSYSFVGGITYQISWNYFLFAGVGYGKDDKYYEIGEFTYDNDENIGKVWVKDVSHSTSGVELDAGAILRLGRVIVSGGAAVVNFKSLNWTAGAGVSF